MHDTPDSADTPDAAATPTTTDFGAPIIAGPFTGMKEAQAWLQANDGGVDIYWAGDQWYVHGPTDLPEGPPLTTYG